MKVKSPSPDSNPTFGTSDPLLTPIFQALQTITYCFSFVNSPALADPHCRRRHKIGLKKGTFCEQIFFPKDDRDFMLQGPSIFHKSSRKGIGRFFKYLPHLPSLLLQYTCI